MTSHYTWTLRKLPLIRRFRDWRNKRKDKPTDLAEGDRFCVSPVNGRDHSYECDVFEAVYISAPLVLAKRLTTEHPDYREVDAHVSFDMTRWAWKKVHQGYIDAVNAAQKGPTDAD